MLHPEEESVKVTLLRFLLTGVQIVPDRSGAPSCAHFVLKPTSLQLIPAYPSQISGMLRSLELSLKKEGSISCGCGHASQLNSGL